MIVLLNPDFNCCDNFALSWVEEGTTGSFALLIANVVALFAPQVTQSDKFKSRFT